MSLSFGNGQPAGNDSESYISVTIVSLWLAFTTLFSRNRCRAVSKSEKLTKIICVWISKLKVSIIGSKTELFAPLNCSVNCTHFRDIALLSRSSFGLILVSCEIWIKIFKIQRFSKFKSFENSKVLKIQKF
jgi:hypothetical protein